MDKKEGKGWTRAQADAAEIAYKQFLQLNLNYPDRSIVPTVSVDAFWDQHILDTQKYAEDCQTIFGYFLHHFPYLGMRGTEDAANLASAFEDTKALHLLQFGETASVGAQGEDSSVCTGTSSCEGGGNCTGAQCSPARSYLRPTFEMVGTA